MFWICVLSSQKHIVFNSVVIFWIHVSCFRQMYYVLDKCIVF